MSEDYEIHTGGEIEVIEESQVGITARERGVWETMLDLARRNPRDIKAATDQAVTLATMDQESAEECFYALNRSGKFITGPSIRLAEILQYTFGRFVTESRVVSIGAKMLTAEGSCMDLERMVRVKQEVSRRITDKAGRRYNDDMITMTANAAQSIAIRNAILRMVPGSIVKKVLREARKVATGDAKTLGERRSLALESFAKMGVTSDRICETLERASTEEITADDVITLRSLWKQITEEGKPIDEAFPEPKLRPDPEGAKAAATATEQAIRNRAPKTSPDPMPPHDPETGEIRESAPTGGLSL